jgi:hypothetical protein
MNIKKKIVSCAPAWKFFSEVLTILFILCKCSLNIISLKNKFKFNQLSKKKTIKLSAKVLPASSVMARQ